MGNATGASRGRRTRVVGGLAVGVTLVVLAAIALVTRGDDAVETVAAAEPTTTGTARPPTTRRAAPTTTTEAAVETTTTTESPASPPETSATAAPPAPTTTATPAPDTTRAAPETNPAPAAAGAAAPPPTTAAPAPSAAPRAVDVFRGLGAWLDVLDWSPTYTGGRQSVAPAAVDRMADLGVQTLYIQTSRFNRPEDVLDPSVLRQFIDRAHARGLRVIAWYMPTHEDQETDVRRLVTAANLPVDGVCVNIESRNQPDVALRNQRLLDLSYRLRAATAKPMSAVVVPPVVTHLINPGYWPQFPWRELSGTYDAWMPMAYWSNRTAESGWRDGYRYIAENTTLIRTLTGNPNAAVHPVGGIGNEITADEVNAMALALADIGAIGGSIYDYATTGDALWPSLHNFRR